MALHEGAWLKELIASQGISQSEFSRRTRIPLPSLGRWLRQPLLKWRMDRKAVVARGLEISVAELEERKRLAELSERTSLENMLKPGVPIGEEGETLGVGGQVLAPVMPPRFKIGEFRGSDAAQPVQARDIPIINSVAAGPLIERTDLDYPAGFADNYVRMALAPKTQAYGLWVEGESMMPRYEPGDLVVFRVLKAGEPIIDGADYSVHLTGEGNLESTFKRFTHHRKLKDVIVANALNPNFKPRSFEIPLSRVARIGHVMMIIPRNR